MTPFVSGQNIIRNMEDGFTIRKPSRIHSRACARSLNEAKRKGCHSGYGKRRTKVLLWIKRMRVSRRFLSKFRETNKIDKHI
ncbi:hypothetical protein IGI04_003485 [Brassica rapa subsp. trilocularis]|uniref:Large ribosomal subunit protein eL19 domain-containing protein n=1 Tax=Brassica rapa subsp. trilocularis TaxID=1813537 RepID=A0ABQ7NYI7_BRACM|nr:hypothetical protein IGI04_003485 [Brassica rapa subsp. trilocularis]